MTLVDIKDIIGNLVKLYVYYLFQLADAYEILYREMNENSYHSLLHWVIGDLDPSNYSSDIIHHRLEFLRKIWENDFCHLVVSSTVAIDRLQKSNSDIILRLSSTVPGAFVVTSKNNENIFSHSLFNILGNCKISNEQGQVFEASHELKSLCGTINTQEKTSNKILHHSFQMS